MHKNISLYVEGKISASQRRVLISTWVGEAWNEVCLNREMIRRAFEKCGISVPIDGSKDKLINIRGLTNYTVDPVQEEGLFELDSDSD